MYPQIVFSRTTLDATDSEKEFVAHVKMILDSTTACSIGQVGIVCSTIQEQKIGDDASYVR